MSNDNEVCEKCIGSIKLVIDKEEVLICQVYGIRVNEDDCCSNFMSKDREE